MCLRTENTLNKKGFNIGNKVLRKALRGLEEQASEAALGLGFHVTSLWLEQALTKLFQLPDVSKLVA